MRQSHDATLAASYPNAIKVNTYDNVSSSRRFNCHGYAWHMYDLAAPLTDPVWIGLTLAENAPERKYFQDGSYQQNSNGNLVGARAYWTADNHTAVCLGGLQSISKWGEGSLMRHQLKDSPYGEKNIVYYTKNYNLTITGPEYVESGVQAEYYLNNPPQGTFTWSVTGSLRIVSGQGTSRIKVEATSTAAAVGTISFRVNQLSNSRQVSINIPRLTHIEGPASVSPGQTAYLNAKPVFAASLGNYQWTCSGGGDFRYSRDNASLSSTSQGSYYVTCKFVTTNGLSAPTSVSFSVSFKNTYRVVASSDTKTISVRQNTAYLADLLTTGRVKYTLYNLLSGAVVDRGDLDKSGGDLSYGYLSKGLYVFVLEYDNGMQETFKLSL